MWNEPNHPRFLLPQYVKGKPASPALYRALHLAGVRGLEAAGQAKDTMLGGETAPGGDRRALGPAAAVPARRLLQGLREAARRRLGPPPLRQPPRPVLRPARQRQRDDRRAWRRLERALDAIGRRSTKVWVTEYGVQSTPDTTLGVPQAQQAEYRSISERILRADPRIAATAQYLLVDDRGALGLPVRPGHGRRARQAEPRRVPAPARG